MDARDLAAALRSMTDAGGLVSVLARMNVEAAHTLRDVVECAGAELRDGQARVVFIGSFSSGKSTLINRLLGDDILPSGRGVVTSRPVEVSHGPRRSIGWIIGHERAMTPVPVSTPIAPLVLMAQRECEGNDSRRLTVALDAWPFDRGVRLVDTPGFNSEERSHRTWAERTVADAEVAVLVVEPRGMTADVREFVRDAIGARVPMLAVVINQLDLVDEEDVDELLQRAAQQLAELGRPEAQVLGCSARGHVDPHGRYVGWDGVRAWVAALAGQRVAAAVAAKVARGVDAAVSEIAASAERERASNEHALARLATEEDANNPAGLAKVSKSCRSRAVSVIDKRAKAVETEIVAAGDAFNNEVAKWASESNKVTDAASVEWFVKARLQAYSARVEAAFRDFDAICGERVRALHGEIAEAARKQWASLRDELGTTLQLGSNTSTTDGWQTRSERLDVAVGELPTEFGSVASAALTGAAIGVFIPVVGPLLGGALGALGGWLFGDARGQAIKQVGEAARGIRERAVAQALAVLQSRREAWRARAKDVAKRQIDGFQTTLNDVRVRVVAEHRALQARDALVQAVRERAETARSNLAAYSKSSIVG